MEQARRVDSYVQNNLVRNFTVNVLDGTFFMLGMSFSSVVTVMPLFVSQLSDSPLLISLIPAIQTMGWLLPQLLTAPLVERLPRKKPFVMLMTLNERLQGREFVATEGFSVADITAAVAVDFARVVKLKPDEQQHPQLLRWRAALAARPSMSL